MEHSVVKMQCKLHCIIVIGRNLTSKCVNIIYLSKVLTQSPEIKYGPID